MNTKGRKLLRCAAGFLTAAFLVVAAYTTTAMASGIGLIDTADLLDIHAEADDSSAVVGQVMDEGHVAILGRSDGWVQIQAGDIVGWVHEGNLIETEVSGEEAVEANEELFAEIEEMAEEANEEYEDVEAIAEEETEELQDGETSEEQQDAEISEELQSAETLEELQNAEVLEEQQSAEASEEQQDAEASEELQENDQMEEEKASAGWQAQTEQAEAEALQKPEADEQEILTQDSAAEAQKAAELQRKAQAAALEAQKAAEAAAKEAQAQAAALEAQKAAEAAAKEAQAQAAALEAQKAAEAEALRQQQEAEAFKQAELERAQKAAEAERQAQAAEEARKAAQKAAEAAAMESRKQSTLAAAGVTEEELYLLANIIYCEAGSEPYIGKVAVGNVVMNRVKSDKQPDTISGVVYAKGQFSPVSNGSLAKALKRGSADESCYQAALEALEGANPVGDKLFFRRVNGRSGQVIGHHVFY